MEMEMEMQVWVPVRALRIDCAYSLSSRASFP